MLLLLLPECLANMLLQESCNANNLQGLESSCKARGETGNKASNYPRREKKDSVSLWIDSKIRFNAQAKSSKKLASSRWQFLPLAIGEKGSLPL